MKKEILLKKEPMSEMEMLQGFVYTLPVIFYINELEYMGDIRSCHTTWLNPQGLDFMGITEAEISGMGFDLFTKIVHPDDMISLEQSLNTIYPAGSNLTSTAILHLKPNGHDHYSSFHCSKIVKETFIDGSVKTMIVAAIEITEGTQTNQLLNWALKDAFRLRNEHIIKSFSKRERDVLLLIKEGLSSKLIADALKITLETVKRHRNNLIHKAGVNNSVELAMFASKCSAF